MKIERPRKSINGFNSVDEYERACKNCGYITERINFNNGKNNFVAITVRLESESPTSWRSFHLITEDEEKEILDGAFRTEDGLISYLNKHGFRKGILK